MLFFSEDVNHPRLKYNTIKKWLLKVIELEGKISGEICVIFSSDKYLLEINKKYLKSGFYTDVISFNYGKTDKTEGDIFISSERVKENAEIYKISLESEMLRVIVHGILHLIGYNDKTEIEKKIMTEKEDNYLGLYEQYL